MTSDALSATAVKKATNLVSDARLAVLVGLIPILGLIYVLRLVQWYLLKRQYPALASADASEHKSLVKDFRAALPRLWFAVLFWPAVILLLFGYIAVTA